MNSSTKISETGNFLECRYLNDKFLEIGKATILFSKLSNVNYDNIINLHAYCLDYIRLVGNFIQLLSILHFTDPNEGYLLRGRGGNHYGRRIITRDMVPPAKMVDSSLKTTISVALNSAI